jgi:hypothetical protein
VLLVLLRLFIIFGLFQGCYYRVFEAA